ncbi:PREDICTED: CMRF35-like molecule 8 [Miniopterus natalensis]|uniref:CMRF35-like molecule 8 n=1 Tax=Miniopterus natalensis TaxID=291302 RepID=UPI0007A6BA1B|nr:PREDICTED: CMRF35-like molecule 8 [Miniopterus natalensis]
MTPRALAPWLPAALLLLCVPGCLSLSGPSRVTGTVGGSLSVQCQYEAEFTEHKKYWCKGLCPTLLKKIVETTKSGREVRRGRVSIRDDPANLTFTVTLENLEKGDEGTYWCGIDRPWREIGWDVTFKVLVSVIPGCLSLSGPSRVTGTVGGSLSVQCQYEAEFTEHKKYWCKGLCPTLLKKIVETTKSGREVRRGRVSIRDDPANLTFTVTLENLEKGDEGTYWCGIDRPWREIGWDVTFKVLVSVIPAWATANVTHITDITHITHSANIQDDFQASPGSGLHLLLTLLVLLLLLLGGTSLLAWRMVRRRNKAGGYSEPPQNPSEQSEPCYANLELQTWPAQGETVQPWQAEVEYSMVQAPREDLHYTTVAFNAQNQHAEDKSPSRRPPQQEPEYSVIKRT